MKKPIKEDFRVYESERADPEYKTHNGIVYNDHMYKEALEAWDDWFDSRNNDN